MQGLTKNYSSEQINNLPKKRRKLNAIIDRLKNGKLSPPEKIALSQKAHRLLKYVTKGASF